MGVDLLDVLLAFAAAPWWLGWVLLAGGLIGFGVWIGVNLPDPPPPQPLPNPGPPPTPKKGARHG